MFARLSADQMGLRKPPNQSLTRFRLDRRRGEGELRVVRTAGVLMLLPVIGNAQIWYKAF